MRDASLLLSVRDAVRLARATPTALPYWTWKVYVTFPVVISCFDFVICGLMATFYCNDSEDKIINQNDQQGEPMYNSIPDEQQKV